MLHLLDRISGRPFGLLVMVLLALSAGNVCMAHDESVPCTIDVVVYPNKAVVVLKFPIQSMLNADASSDPANLVRVVAPLDLASINRDVYLKSKAKQMSQGLRLTFDGVSLAPQVLSIAGDELVLGFSNEEEMPRAVGIYEMVYLPDHEVPPPKLVTLDYNLLPAPNDGSNINVTCLVTHKQVDHKSPYPVFLSDGDRMTMTFDWAATLAAAQPSMTAATKPSVAAAPASTAATTKRAKDPQEVGNLYIMIGTGVIVAAVVLMVLAFIYLRER